MASYAPRNPPPPWPKLADACVLYHGCTRNDATAIQANGIDLNRCRPDADFGRGFYMTTVQRQAENWAWYRSQCQPGSAGAGSGAVVLAFRVPRDHLARLETLCFPRGTHDYEDVWSLITHFRQPPPGNHHERTPPARRWYDVVWGPVSVLWQQRYALPDADQVSFHTHPAVALLDRTLKLGSVTETVLQSP